MSVSRVLFCVWMCSIVATAYATIASGKSSNDGSLNPGSESSGDGDVLEDMWPPSNEDIVNVLPVVLDSDVKQVFEKAVHPPMWYWGRHLRGELDENFPSKALYQRAIKYLDSTRGTPAKNVTRGGNIPLSFLEMRTSPKAKDGSEAASAELKAGKCSTSTEWEKYMEFSGVDKDRETGVQLLVTPFLTIGRNVSYLPISVAGEEGEEASAASGESAARRSLRFASVGVADGSSDDDDSQESREESGEISSEAQGRVPMPHGMHYFIQIGNPQLTMRTRRCYDPKLKYEEDLNLIGPDSDEVKFGCTPYRIKAMQIQGSVKCAIDQIGKAMWMKIEDNVIHLLGSEAQVASTTDFGRLIKERLSNLARDMNGVALLPSQIGTVKECFESHQDKLRCLPVMAGSIGVLGTKGRGLWDHSEAWIDGQMKILQTCHVPTGCARYASETLLGFNRRSISPFVANGGRMRIPPWQTECKSIKSVTNSKLFSACFFQALKHACKDHPECCPSNAIHFACEKEINSEGCSRVCQFPRIPM